MDGERNEAMFTIDFLSQHRVFDGVLYFIRHDSQATGGPMHASVFVPDYAEQRTDVPFPVLYWMSGLTCTDKNFSEKSGAYRKASELGLIVVAPDTSPRGASVPNNDSDSLGHGAGFYVDATQAPWSQHFKMETYITRDLIQAIEDNFPADPARRGIFGHSMGGHGALTLAMNHPHLYRSVSAFSPIASAMHAPWGEQALSAYLGTDRSTWERYDAALLMANEKGKPFGNILIDQGSADPFLDTQLMPYLLQKAAEAAGQKITLRFHEGYDHGYYFVQSFMDDHLSYHAERLKPLA